MVLGRVSGVLRNSLRLLRIVWQKVGLFAVHPSYETADSRMICQNDKWHKYVPPWGWGDTWVIYQLLLQFRAEIDSSVFVCNTQAIVSVSVFSVLTTITCGWLFKLSSNQLANWPKYFLYDHKAWKAWRHVWEKSLRHMTQSCEIYRNMKLFVEKSETQ